jgi:hypothetical protein
VLARVFTAAVALCIAATGVLPALDGSRCVSMDRSMTPSENCPRCHSAPPVSIGNPCCEAVHVSSLEARASSAPHDDQLWPAPLAALLPALSLEPPSQTAFHTIDARPRGQPRFVDRSVILRV